MLFSLIVCRKTLQQLGIAFIVFFVVSIIQPSVAFATSSVVSSQYLGDNPFSVDVNPDTNKVYVTMLQSRAVFPYDSKVSVFDGLTGNSIDNITVTAYPTHIAINPIINRIYVSNGCTCPEGLKIQVIDGSNDKVVDNVMLSSNPVDLVVNPNTNKIYVSLNQNLVSVIDGATNRIIANITGIDHPEKIAINSDANKIFVTHNTNSITVIDGTNDRVVSDFAIKIDTPDSRLHPIGNQTISVAVSQSTGRIYLVSLFTFSPCYNCGVSMPFGVLSVIDGTTGKTVETLPVINPHDVIVDSSLGLVYFTDYSSPSGLSFIDEQTNKKINVDLGSSERVGSMQINAKTLGINTNTKTLYAIGSGKLMIIDVNSADQLTPQHEKSQNTMSPRQQMANGISPENVVCQDDMVLVKKSIGNSVVCVKPQTAQKLFERGWGLSIDTSKQITPIEPAKQIKSTGESFQGMLQFGICGEDKNPKINGTGENPIVLKRDSGQVVLPFCITQRDPNHLHWNLQVGYEPSYFSIKPQHGINVNLSETSIDLSAIIVNSTNTPQFTATITADPSTELGVHIFMIKAMYPLESGASAVLGKAYYVNIQS